MTTFSGVAIAPGYGYIPGAGGAFVVPVSQILGAATPDLTVGSWICHIKLSRDDHSPIVVLSTEDSPATLEATDSGTFEMRPTVAQSSRLSPGKVVIGFARTDRPEGLAWLPFDIIWPVSQPVVRSP